MACNCKGGAKKEVYVATFRDGTQRTYNSKIEAEMAVQRNGGSFQKK